MRREALLAFAIGFTFAAGCTSSSQEQSGEVGGTMTAAGTTVAGMTGSGTQASDSGSSGAVLDVNMMPEPQEIAEVFGHSGDTLYRLDVNTSSVEVIGTFDGCQGSIIDIALDADSNMYGTSFTALYTIDRETAACTLVAKGVYPTSLSFVPAATVDATKEALVGFVDAEYVRIDVVTGEITPLGTLTGGLSSSGDMVSVKDGGSWLTVEGPGCLVNDCIVELNPSNGLILQNHGPLPYDEVFGLAFWGGNAYGFSRDGELFRVEFTDGGIVVTLIPIPDAPAGLSFFGAGSTTSAPPAVG